MCKTIENLDFFCLCHPTQLGGLILLGPPNARALFLHDHLLCNGLARVLCLRGAYRTGGTNGNDPKILFQLSLKIN